jgi:hypothetical protein
LSDDNKRKTYDQTGSTEENPFGKGFSQEDIFRNYQSQGYGSKSKSNMGGF